MDSRHWRRIAAALLMLVFMLARLTSPARATPAARTPITISDPALGGITPVPAATGSTHPVQIALVLLFLFALVAGAVWNKMRSQRRQEDIDLPEQGEPPLIDDPELASLIARLEARIDRLDRAVQLLDRRMATLQGIETEPEPPAAVPAAPPLAAAQPESALSDIPSIDEEVPPAVAEGHPLPPRWRPDFSRSSARRPRIASVEDLEALISGRGLAWVGGLALLIGALFFLSLAFNRGWIGPAARVIIGLVASLPLMGLGAWLIRRRDILLGQVLVAVGIGVSNLSLLAATRLYHLVPLELGLLGVLAGAVAAAVIAIRTDSQIMAGYGIVSALVAPPIFGAAPDGATVAFLAAALIGTTVIALSRTWRWLPPVAFVLTVPQAATWFHDVAIHDKPVGSALVALTGFWLLYIVASGGDVFRTRDASLRSLSATLLLANAVFTVASGFVLLSGSLEHWRGLFLLAVALAHGAVGGAFLAREGETHPFGLLAAGTGVAALTMAVPVQLGGPAVPLAWASEAVALAWVATVRRHRSSAAASLIAGLLAIGHLLAFEYPLAHLPEIERHGIPFVNAAGGTLAYLLLALAVTGFIVRERAIRMALAVTGLLLAAYAVPFELGGLWMLVAWSALTLLAIGVQRIAATVANRATGAIDLASVWTRSGLFLPAAVIAAVAIAHLLAVDLPAGALAHRAVPGVPFTDRGTAAAAVVIAAATLAAWVTRHGLARQIATVTGLAVIAWLLPFELGGGTLVFAWSVLGLALLLLDHRFPAPPRLYAGASAVVMGVAIVQTARVAPVSRLAVEAMARIDGPPFLNSAAVALASLTGVALVLAWLHRADKWGARLTGVAGALAVYLLSIGVVDVFQRRVGGDVSLESLQRGAQVALSILWAVLGGLAIAVGIVRSTQLLRLAGLVLLGLATAKVFIVDLAFLNTTYRVLSFIGLGSLLLLSSYIYRHLRGQDRPAGPGQRPPAAGTEAT